MDADGITSVTVADHAAAEASVPKERLVSIAHISREWNQVIYDAYMAYCLTKGCYRKRAKPRPLFQDSLATAATSDCVVQHSLIAKIGGEMITRRAEEVGRRNRGKQGDNNATGG